MRWFGLRFLWCSKQISGGSLNGPIGWVENCYVVCLHLSAQWMPLHSNEQQKRMDQLESPWLVMMKVEAFAEGVASGLSVGIKMMTVEALFAEGLEAGLFVGMRKMYVEKVDRQNLHDLLEYCALLFVPDCLQD